MKKLLMLSLILVSLTACATPIPLGVIYTDNDFPVQVSSQTVHYSKKGVAQCKSILLLVSTGDCSLTAAMKNGNITKVNHTDWHATNILGIYGEYTLTAYGD
jgi:TRL-like protein family